MEIKTKDRKKLEKGLSNLGMKMLNDTDNIMEDIYEYIEKKKEEEQVIFGYVFIARLLAGFPRKQRDGIIYRLQKETNWDIIDEELDNEQDKKN